MEKDVDVASEDIVNMLKYDANLEDEGFAKEVLLKTPFGRFFVSKYDLDLESSRDEDYVVRVLTTIRNLTSVKRVYCAKFESKDYETYLEEVRAFVKTDDYKRLSSKGKKTFTQIVFNRLCLITVKSIGLEDIGISEPLIPPLEHL